MSQIPLKPWASEENGISTENTQTSDSSCEAHPSLPIKPSSSYISTESPSNPSITPPNALIQASIGTHSAIPQSSTQPLMRPYMGSSIGHMGYENTNHHMNPYMPSSDTDLSKTLSVFGRYSQALQLTMQSASNLVMQVIGLLQKFTMFKMEMDSLFVLPLLFRPFRWLLSTLFGGLRQGVRMMTFGLISLPVPSFQSAPSHPQSYSPYPPYQHGIRNPGHHHPASQALGAMVFNQQFNNPHSPSYSYCSRPQSSIWPSLLSFFVTAVVGLAVYHYAQSCEPDLSKKSHQRKRPSPSTLSSSS